MAGFNIQKPGGKTAATAESEQTKEAQPQVPKATEFIASSPDTLPDSWRTPMDTRAWKKAERSPYNLLLSPPQKDALTLVANLNLQSVQEYVLLRLEQDLIEELERLAVPEVGGRHAHDAAQALAYLRAWGDLAAGRNQPGRH